jgi:hypothetical protein
LGHQLARFTDRPLTCREVLWLLSLGISAVLGAWIVGIWRYIYGYAHYGPSAATAWSQPWFLLAALTSIAFLWLAFFRLLRAHRTLAIYQHGLRLQRDLGRSYTLAWKDLQGIRYTGIQERFLGLPWRQRHHARLLLSGGKSIPLPPLQNFPQAVEAIKKQLYPHILPRLRNQLRAGKPAQFGPLSLHQHGITLRKRRIPWKQITHIQLTKGFLVIELAANRSVRISLDRLPNPELILHLVDLGVNYDPQRAHTSQTQKPSPNTNTQRQASA